MEVSAQRPYLVATTEGGKREKQDYMLRVRVSPTKRYELKCASEELKMNESATIRWLIENYPAIKEAHDYLAMVSDFRELGLRLFGFK